MHLGAILIALFTAIAVKGTVMVLAGYILFRVFRTTSPRPLTRRWLHVPNENLREFRILRWSLVLFFVAELACGLEIYVLMESLAALACLHGVASGLAMGLFALGMYLYSERTLIRYGDSRCLANRICHGCTIAETEGCKMRRTILLLGAFVALATLPPLAAPAETMYADMNAYVLPVDSVNEWFDQDVVPWLESNVAAYDPSARNYFISGAELVVEFRLLPMAALLLSVAAVLLVWIRREAAGMGFMAFAVGMLGYVYLEIALYAATREALIGSLGHEVSELWFLVITAEFLRRAFPRNAAPAPEAA